jgi:hypothetical protein
MEGGSICVTGRNDMAEVNGIKSLCIAALLVLAGIVTQTGTLSAQD